MAMHRVVLAQPGELVVGLATPERSGVEQVDARRHGRRGYRRLRCPGRARTPVRIGAVFAAALLLAACADAGRRVRVAGPDGSGPALAGPATFTGADSRRPGAVADHGPSSPGAAGPAASPVRVAEQAPAGELFGGVAHLTVAFPGEATSQHGGATVRAGSSAVSGPADPWRLPAAVVIDLTAQRAIVLDPDGVEIVRLLVSTGGPGSETPEGDFAVVGRQRVGTAKGDGGVHMDFFTVFNGDIGFHGIPWAWTRDDRLWTPLGEYGVSHGCIRMADHDAEYLYTYLPDGAPVLVRS